jgi:hypothetical protein
MSVTTHSNAVVAANLLRNGLVGRVLTNATFFAQVRIAFAIGGEARASFAIAFCCTIATPEKITT